LSIFLDIIAICPDSLGGLLRKVTVGVPASTANIGPGFDILGLALTLYNTVTVELLSDNSLEISYSGEGRELITTDKENLIYKAIELVYRSKNIAIPGMRITIQNEIPLMGGLGSSSSAIVSGIVAGDSLAGTNLTQLELLKLAVELDGHPDNVTPALFGGFTLSYTEPDGSPAVIPLQFPADLNVLAITPDFHVSTQEARKVMPPNYPLSVVTENTTRLIRLVRALEANDLSQLSVLLDDRIHQPYRYELVPGFKRGAEIACEKGALGAFISGSGPTLGIFLRGQGETIAQAVTEHFTAAGLSSRTRYLKPDFDGARVIN